MKMSPSSCPFLRVVLDDSPHSERDISLREDLVQPVPVLGDLRPITDRPDEAVGQFL